MFSKPLVRARGVLFKKSETILIYFVANAKVVIRFLEMMSLKWKHLKLGEHFNACDMYILSMKSNGSADDIALDFFLEGPTVRFGATVYVSDLELKRQSDLLKTLSGDLYKSIDVNGSALTFGPKLKGSPSARIGLKAAHTGKISVRVELANIVNSSMGTEVDSCVVNFATDVASCDKFLYQLQSLASMRQNDAQLNGLAFSSL